MAIYHFSAKVIGRSGGRSAIASAAYRAAERLHDDALGRDHDYTAKAGVIHSEILLPEGAPERWRDRGMLWNEVEAGEKRKDAQLARDIEISLPRELSRAEAIQLARDYVQEQFVDRGMVADLNVHWTPAADGELQPHAHVMLTMREVVPGREGYPEEGTFGKKMAAWNDRALLRGWRERWAELANERLAELGQDLRIDHRSYRDQGIDLEPQHKIGPVGVYRDEERALERAAEHREIARRNGEKLLDDPSIALKALTYQQSTFTRQDLARFIDRHTDGAEQFGAVLGKVQAAPELVRLGEDGRGRERFTTSEMLQVERRMEASAASLGQGRGHVLAPGRVAQARLSAEQAGLVLGTEQAAALAHVTEGRDLALVVGYAGSGKSAMLGVARTAWEAEGYQVRGLALSGIAAEGLEAGSGIGSRTIASMEYAWGQGKDQLTRRDVLVVDEAGMIGSRQMERVLSAAERAGAKVVLVGDPEQLQAIEAGAAFRALAERHGAAEITEIRRQHAEWQRQATQELAWGRTAEALGRYAQAGMVHEAASRDEAKAGLVAGWEEARRARPDESRIILAYTRDDVRDLNERARARMRETGALSGPDQAVATERGERAFAAGDRIMFLRNERGLGAGTDGPSGSGWSGRPDGAGGVAVKNGTLGTVLAIEGERLTVRLDRSGKGQDGRAVTFSVRDYGHIDHGYAATVHKAQGVTVDRAHVLATPHMDRHAAYVGLTRHREGVALHYATAGFADAGKLARVLGRERAKDTTLDYGVPGSWESEPDLVRRYAERRGLVPESQIIIRQQPEQAPERVAECQAEAPPPRRSRFAGLKLGTAPGAIRQPVDERAVKPPELARAPAPASRVVPGREEAQADRLARGLTAYARAWEDAARMERAGLPVLPHQQAALDHAGQALEQVRPGLALDAAAALRRNPELAASAATGQAREASVFGQAIGWEKQARERLEERARAVVREWGKLERAYAVAEKDYDWQARHEIGKRMETFAKELKRDPQLDSLLRNRGKQLGVAEGSGLERVAQAREEDLSRTLRREVGISLGRGLGMGL